ncbi:MAG: alanine:cation symporter family protein [Frankiaceae bacterium]|nr:alanine:cation symporter family protein [Frankiaceae bacterium]
MGAALLLAVQEDGSSNIINENFTRLSTFVQDVIFFSVKVNGAKIPLVVVWLIFAAVFMTVYFRAVNVRGFRHAIGLVKGDYTGPDEEGEVSHFQALATAVSGTVGLGNIAGVAVAITIGGPGATFWMILAGLLSMSTKFAECTLGVKYRRVNADGSISGGPMYYLSRGLAEQGKVRLGRVLAVVFAVFCIFGSLGGGNAFQSNQALAQMRTVTGGDDGLLGGSGAGIAFGVVLAIFVGVVIIGGIKRIARVTDKLVPFMAVFYVTACLIVLGGNFGAIPEAFGLIVEGAFTPDGITGGVIGVLITGFQRAAFSNEAGLGSAPIAHSAVQTNRPVTEGYVSLLEPFIDTVVICTMTALTIVITGAYTEVGTEGVQLTSQAFESVLPWFPNVLAVAVLLFAFSTQLAWSYYGAKATAYLFNESKTADTVYKAIFLLFIVIGAASSLDVVIGFSDAMIFAMSIPNLIGVYLLLRVVKRELREYEQDRASGVIVKVSERV